MNPKLNQLREMRRSRKRSDLRVIMLMVIIFILVIAAAKVTGWEKFCESAQRSGYKDSLFHKTTGY